MAVAATEEVGVAGGRGEAKGDEGGGGGGEGTREGWREGRGVGLNLTKMTTSVPGFRRH